MEKTITLSKQKLDLDEANALITHIDMIKAKTIAKTEGKTMEQVIGKGLLLYPGKGSANGHYFTITYLQSRCGIRRHRNDYPQQCSAFLQSLHVLVEHTVIIC